MEKTRSNYEDYWNELQELHREAKNVDDYPDEENTKQFPEGEQESDWLRDVGLDNLTEIFQQGREITDSELNACISLFSNQHAEAVKKRVRSLNQTVSNRYRQQRGRHRKPDIRDVFRDMETSSTGTRSRSATPDSLDFVDVDVDMEDEWNDCPHTENTASRETLRRSPSAPTPKIQVRSGHDMFKKSGNWHGQRLNVASDSEGIELLGYQRFGTMPRGLTERARSESDPSVTLSSLDIIALEKAEAEPLSYRNRFHNEVSRSHNNLFQSAEEASGPVSFESFCREAEPIRYVTELDDSNLIEIDALSDAEYSQLKPLLWLEVSAIFDKYSVEFHKKKPYKRKRKEHGNVFGVSLSTLVMRDRRISNDNSTVPQIFKIILGELETRCCREEGILRIAGQKQRVETLCSEIEAHFYTKPEEVRYLLKNSLCHELIAVLKKLLRDLPQPLLTSELVNLFYKIHELPTVECQCKVLNLLVLLLPLEHSGTLRTLMSFLDCVIRNEKYNKMSLHNVAMIIAPSLFPPKYVYPLEKSDLNDQVKMAAVCCRLVEVLLQYRLEFWRIPSQLRLQLQQKIQSVAARKLKSGQSKHVRRKEKEPLRRSNTQYDSSSRMYTAVRL